VNCKGREDGGRVWTAVGKEVDSSGEGICSCREDGSVEGCRKPEKSGGGVVPPP
jgi:hypothetical protein